MQHEAMLPTRRRGRPRASDADDRADALLDAAEHLFLLAGYHQASVENIARTAGVAARTIYSRFGGKPGLLAAVIERWRAVQITRLLALDERRDGDDELLVALAMCLIEGSLSRKSRLLYNASMVKRDLVLGLRLYDLAWGPWRERLLAVLASPGWRLRSKLTCPVDVMADMFTGQMIARGMAALHADPDGDLVGDALHLMAMDETRRFIDAVTMS